MAGRPKILENPQSITLNVEGKQLEELKSLASERGITISELIRKTLFPETKDTEVQKTWWRRVFKRD